MLPHRTRYTFGGVLLFFCACLFALAAASSQGIGMYGLAPRVATLLNVALVLVVGCIGLQLRRPIPSAGVRTGHIVLYETPMWQAVGRRTPPVTNRGASDAIERYIRRAEFGALFNRVAVWRPSSHPVAELPGEALGVWGRRKCQRLRRILRERGASVEVRREAGPPHAVASGSRSW